MKAPPEIFWKCKDGSLKIQPAKSKEGSQNINFQHSKPRALTHFSKTRQNPKGGMSPPLKPVWKNKTCHPKSNLKTQRKFQNIQCDILGHQPGHIFMKFSKLLNGKHRRRRKHFENIMPSQIHPLNPGGWWELCLGKNIWVKHGEGVAKQWEWPWQVACSSWAIERDGCKGRGQCSKDCKDPCQQQRAQGKT